MDDIHEVKIMDNYSSRSRKSHFKKFFNFYIILYMDFIFLKEIKSYIINNFVNKKLAKFIQPTYEKEKLLMVHIPVWQDFQKFKTKKRNTIDGSLYLAFLLGGEGFHVEKIRTASVQLMELPGLCKRNTWRENQDGISTKWQDFKEYDGGTC